MLNHREFFGICLLICCVVFATAVWSEQPKNTVKNINPSPEKLGAIIPEIQQQFMHCLAEYAAKYQASPNAVQKFLLRQKRQHFCTKTTKFGQKQQKNCFARRSRRAISSSSSARFSFLSFTFTYYITSLL